ncbi:MAG TPA: helix-hairpin-helix domain-containing protein, partial [Solirubrobacterales bacterium]|nr:helix-hairpin-helix domain-containing protein [Solirubrobacterales bacterium]
ETVRDETARQTREELERLRAELEEELDSRGKLIEEAEQRAERAEAKVADVETARHDAEVDARSAAAEWLRGQTKALQRDAGRAGKAQVAVARGATAEAQEAADTDVEGVEEAPAVERAEAPEATDDAETDEQAVVERQKGRRGFSLGRLRPRRRRAAEEADDAAVATEDEAERKPAGVDDAGAERAVEAGETKRESPAKAAHERKAKAAEAQTTSRGKSAAETARSRPKRPSGSPLDVNRATFEQLRDLGMSVTQATRVIAYRERQAGFDSVDELESVPGIPETFVSELKDRLTV